MSDCCSTSLTSKATPKRHKCPVNGKEYKEVSARTIIHHIKEPWAWKKANQTYYFCDDPECEVVYFGQDNSVINRAELRTAVGIKEKTASALLCYCFGVSFAEASANPEIRQFIIEKTKSNLCACETRNPSGKCCLTPAKREADTNNASH